MILITKTSGQTRMHVFIKLHITTQSGPVILIILCHYATRIDPPEGGSMILITKCMYVCMCVFLCVCLYVCMYVCMYACMYVCIYLLSCT